MKMTDALFSFIDEYCEYDWRDSNRKFYVWIPVDIISDFVSLIDFRVFEYGFIEDCSLSKEDLCIELSYFVDDVREWFPKEDK